MPLETDLAPNRVITADHYTMVFEWPQFDDKWKLAMVARVFIYCPADEELDAVNDWFEPQLKGIRLTPSLHQTLKENAIFLSISHSLESSPSTFFDNFIYTLMTKIY